MEMSEVAIPGLRKVFTAFTTLAMINPTNTINSMALFMTDHLKMMEVIENGDCG